MSMLNLPKKLFQVWNAVWGSKDLTDPLAILSSRPGVSASKSEPDLETIRAYRKERWARRTNVGKDFEPVAEAQIVSSTVVHTPEALGMTEARRRPLQIVESRVRPLALPLKMTSNLVIERPI